MSSNIKAGAIGALAFVLGLGVPAFADDKAATPADKKAEDKAKSAAPAVDGPKLQIAEDKKDAGVIPQGEVVKQTFLLKNTGKADLHVTDVKPACGCTASDYDKVIKPGGEGKITLSIETKNFTGPISKSAVILTDDPSAPQHTIFVTANVKPYVEVLPQSYFRLTALTGEPASSDVVIVSDEADFKPSKAEVSQAFLKVDLQPVAEKDRVPNKNANQYKVVLTAGPDTPEGILSGAVVIQTGSKKQPELRITYSGFVKPTVSVTPTAVNFGNFETKGDPVKRYVTVINNNSKNETFSVTKAETSIPGVSAEVVSSDKGKFQVVLTVDQKIKKGPFDGQLVIRTNDSTRNEVKIPIKGVIL